MSRTTITVRVVDQTIQVITLPRIASGGVDELQIRFDFCSLWDGCGKTAVFYRDVSQVYHIPIVDSVAVVPHEVLTEAGHFYFGVMGAAENIRTTEVLKVKVVQGAITEATANSEPITPGIYQQLLAAYDKTEQRVDELIAAQSDGGVGLGELVDIRVGEDGTRYASAGAAVRGQIKALKNMMGLPGFSVTMEGETGNWVTFYPKAGSPISIYSTIEPILPQPSQGDPSPQNPLPIYGYDSLAVAIGGTDPDPENPYTAYEADLGQPVGKGTFDWSTGVLTLTHKIMSLTGNEVWNAEGNISGEIYRYYCRPSSGGIKDSTQRCSHYPYLDSYAAKTEHFYVSGTVAYFFSTIPTRSEFMAYLQEQAAAGTPVQIFYTLEQPEVIQLAPVLPKAPGGGANDFFTSTPATFTYIEDPIHTMESQQRQIETLVQRVAALEAAAVNNT